MKTRFLWMILKISLPSGRHRERRKLNHFDKFLYFLPQRVAIEKRQKLRGKWKYLFYPSRGRARKIGFYALFSKIICFRLKIGVSYQLLKERGSKLAQIFACGIKIDAAFGSGISAVASKLMPFWLPPHLFPVGEAIYQGVFEKTFKNSVAARESGYCPFTYSMFESHFVPPSKRFLHLTHTGKPFCQPIRRGFLLQFLTATFATEKRHDFWKNFPSTLYRNFRSRKTTYFPKLFQKMFSPLYRTFSGKKRTHFFKKASCSYTASFFGRI